MSRNWKTIGLLVTSFVLVTVFTMANAKADLVRYSDASEAGYADLTEIFSVTFSGQSSKLATIAPEVDSLSNTREVDLQFWIPILFKAEAHYHHYNASLDTSFLDDSWELGGFTIEASLNGIINGIVYSEADVLDFASVVVTEDSISFTTWCGLWKKDLVIPIHFDPCIDIKIIFWGKHGCGPDDKPGTAVPEPATMLMLGAGLAGLGLARRKRKRKI